MNAPPLLLIAAFSLAALAAPAAGASPLRASLAELGVDRLKTAYLSCDRAASETALDPSSFQRCAAVADELLERGFGGDFDRMIAWWRLEKARAARAEPDALPRP